MSTDFYSMDKLVEFGMSMTIADQMATSMNQLVNIFNCHHQNAGCYMKRASENSEAPLFVMLKFRTRPESISLYYPIP